MGKDNGKVYTYEDKSLVEYNFLTGYKSILNRSIWQVVDSFATLEPKDALQRYSRPVIFNLTDSVVITFTGSGLVYGMGRGGPPKRIDNTYYSGFNFESFRTIYEDQLYSFGGTGFWTRNNNMLYFDNILKEWERLSAFEGVPEEYVELFSAETKKGEYVLGNLWDPQYSTGELRHEIYRLDLTKRTISELGVFSFDTEKRAKQYDYIGSIGSHFFMEIDKTLYVGDVVGNRLYRLPNLIAGTGSFNGYEGILISGEEIILIYSASTMVNPNIRIEALSLEDFLARCDDANQPVYIGRGEYLISVYTLEILTILFLIILLGGFLIRYNLAQPVVEKQFVQSLNESQKRLLRYLILLPPSERATIADIDKILDTFEKSWENQRKIRSKSIQGINQQAQAKMGYNDLVERIPNPDDMRERMYQISAEHRTHSKTLLRHL